MKPRRFRRRDEGLAWIRGIADLANLSAFRGCARELPNGLESALPLDVPAGQFCLERGRLQSVRAGIDSATTSTGGIFKFIEPGDFAGALYANSVTFRAGVTVIEGLGGPVTAPRVLTSATGAWAGENPGSDASDSTLTSSSYALAFKTITGATQVSRQALLSAASGNFDLEEIIRNDIARVIATAIDLGALYGLGSANQPLGIGNNTSVETFVAAADSGNGGALAAADAVGMREKLALRNVENRSSFAFVSNPQLRAKANVTARMPNNGPLWKDNGTMLGFPAFATTQVPSNLTKGTSTTVCSALIFGAFEDLIIGFFGPGVAFVVDPFKLKLQNMIEISVSAYVDVALRYTESFEVAKDLLTT